MRPPVGPLAFAIGIGIGLLILILAVLVRIATLLAQMAVH